jgi:hypothetical protein
MTLVPDLRAELVGAMERGPRRRRPPLALALAPIVLVLAFVVWPRADDVADTRPGRVADLPRPIQQVMSQGTMKIKPGSPLSAVQLTDAGGLGWTSLAYLTDGRAVAHTAAPAGLDGVPGVWANGAFPIGSGLLHSGSITQATLSFARSGGTDHYLVSGTVDARATTVVVELGGERALAELSLVTLTLPIPRDDPGLTAEGRRQRARMPDSVSVRAFAATFTPDRLSGLRTARPAFRTTLEGGAVTSSTGARSCVDRGCGAIYPRAGR